MIQRFWGWIPHLRCKLSDYWSENDVKSILLGENSDVKYGLHIDDEKPEEYWITTFTLSGSEFNYGTKCLSCNIKSYNVDGTETNENVEIVIHHSGLVEYSIESLPKDSKYCRDLINELHYLLKRLFHDDIFHDSDAIHLIDSKDGEISLNHGNHNKHEDSILPPFNATQEWEGIEKLAKHFYIVLDENINHLKDSISIEFSKKKSHLKNLDERLDLCKGFLVYGKNFAKNVLGTNSTSNGQYSITKEEMLDCLENYESVYDSFSTYRHTKYLESINNKTIRLTISTIALAIISIFVALISGSTIANILSDYEKQGYAYNLELWVMQFTVIIAILGIIGVLYYAFIYLKR